MTDPTVLLVGCGNIGSRHLQALARLPGPAAIHIVEPDPAARDLARQRFLEAAGDDPSRFELSWHENLPDQQLSSDLAIVATPSMGRVELIEQLLARGHSRLLVEKVVCQSDEEYERLLAMMHRHNAVGWVNLPRRYYPDYRRVKEIFSQGSLLNLTTVGGAMGLGCNAIHFVDLLLWLADESTITLDGGYLYPQLFENKRCAGLVEFAGTITGQTPKGHVLTVTFLPFDNPTINTVAGEPGQMVIDETLGNIMAVGDLARQSNLTSFKELFVSQTTTAIVADIMKDGMYDLPTLEDSARVHSELFRIFNHHIEKLTGQRPQLCPIT